jgi:hypothetical protein
MNNTLLEKAIVNVNDILNTCINHDQSRRSLVVYDNDFGLTQLLTSAYKSVLTNNADFVDFNSKTREEIIDLFNSLQKDDLVVLIQSTNFLLNEFRIRLHLFNLGLRVVEHMHLARNDESVWDVYVNSLEYDKNWLPVIAPKLKSVLDQSKKLRIISGDAQLEVNGKLEDAKLNIGDYTGMINIGGTFPIGEVFTEAEDFSAMNGSFYVYAYADKNFNVQMHEPFMVTINNGLIISCADNTPADFLDMIELVKSYERPLIRELGFGLNKAITKERFLSDITAFERILGLHFSLGEKHSVYKKDGITTNKTKFHIDIFPVVDEVYADDVLIFKDGRYLV